MKPKFSLRNALWLLFWVGLTAIVVVNWQHFLAAAFVGSVLFVGLSSVVAVPTYVISLVVDRSTAKASLRVKQAFAVCAEIAGQISSGI